MSKQDTQQLLKQLGKEAKRRQEEAAAQARKEKAQAFDFAAAVGAVVPLKSSNRVPLPQEKGPLKRRFDAEGMMDEGRYFYVSEESEREPPRSFCKNGRGQDDIRRLVSGHWPRVARLDLHGYTREEAQQVLSEFIEEGYHRRGVCAEIVHGSGLGSQGFAPVLKNLVRRWLMAHPDVLAYAEPHGGNDGAVLVLLRKRRDE
ncbi:DNA mismatch repair protein MutS [Eikenella longinqua]|uniref:DNA mismatch repair protein MutS n=1 Tax=Eikenella longinqua TaxID=1795827 RepID=A0A1A9RYN9_9NEIS|nr:Smr/MutS family protein [Eikenella longinqua]OAM28360.1 DNA mismatch repair protein MutS [Eikenella longinqua]